jgi:hypothetical protein
MDAVCRIVASIKTSLHRWVGRVYAVSVFISGSSAFVVATHATGGGVTSSGFVGLALFWVTSTAWAVGAIRGRPRQINAHRKASILSYAMTLSAVSQRIYLGIILGATGFNVALALQISSWLCWIPHLIPVWFLWRRLDQRAEESLPRIAQVSEAATISISG